MKLYFCRHAEAEPISEGKTDHDRQLTGRGITRTQTAARVMARLKLKAGVFYTSPRVRARHTADILAETMGGEVRVRDEVNFDFNLPAVEKLIAETPDEDGTLFFVGHEPSMSIVIRALTGGNVVMKKGSVARVDVTPSASPLRGRLVWLATPKLFEALSE